MEAAKRHVAARPRSGAGDIDDCPGNGITFSVHNLSGDYRRWLHPKHQIFYLLAALQSKSLGMVTPSVFSRFQEAIAFDAYVVTPWLHVFHFKIEDMKPGRYNVRVKRNGFLEAGKHRGRYHSQALTLKRGQEIKDLVFRMQPAAVIAGKIVDAEGDPVAGAIIYVTRSGSGARSNVPFGSFHSTNDLGEYRIFDLPPGRYLLLAHPLPVPATPSAEI